MPCSPTTMCPVPRLLCSRPPCVGVRRMTLITELVISGAQMKIDRISAVMRSRLRAVDGERSPYLSE